MQNQIECSPLLTIQEATKVLRIGRTKLYAEIAEGRLKAVKAGQRTFVPTKSATDWIESLPNMPLKKKGGAQ